jgi:peptide/nickel transport system permease protein
MFVHLDWPPWAGLAVVVYPRVFRYTRNILSARSETAAVFSARAAGLREGRILLKYILWPAAPELLAVVGVSASLAFSASIPMEALCDVPGVGSLAWQAALSRDFPLLVNVTMLVALIVLAANALSEILTGAIRRETA